MIFNSVSYAIFLLVVFVLYWTVFKKSIKTQNILLLISSYVFYAWWDYRFVLLIIFSSVVDYNAAIFIDKTEDKRKRKLFLLISIFINLGLLCFFKYFNFLIDTTNYILNGIGSPTHYSFKDLILPIGISFYTFQALSYTIDVYRGKLKATRDPLAYFVFVSFFPQIAAGPIERAVNLLPQFIRERTFDLQQSKEGLRLILWGVFKKVAVADLLATYVDIVYQSPGSYSGFSTFLGAVFFAVQVYCDFSGYSDMAIGSARLLGINLSRNFNTPFFSKSMTELWQRWHITLNSWFRDYVYIPLGGSKNGNFNRYKNVLIVFLISGLWHGASWKYIVWGGLTGTVVIFELMAKEYAVFTFWNNTPKIIRALKTFSLFVFSLIFFRAATFNDGLISLRQLTLNWGSQFSSWINFKAEICHLFLDVREFIVVMLTLVVFILLDYAWRKEGPENEIQKYPQRLKWAVYYALIIWLCLLGEINDYNNTFVYFQF
ncbi:MAG: MBOAT family O-acyltransferase [Bacteroidota bacterium]